MGVDMIVLHNIFNYKKIIKINEFSCFINKI